MKKQISRLADVLTVSKVEASKPNINKGKRLAMSLFLTLAIFIGLPMGILAKAEAYYPVDRSNYSYLFSGTNDQNITFTEGNSKKTIYVGRAYSIKKSYTGYAFGLNEWTFPGYNYVFSTSTIGGLTMTLKRYAPEHDLAVTIDGITYNRASPLYLEVSKSGTLVPGIYNVKMTVPVVWYYGPSLYEYYEYERVGSISINVTLTVVGATPTYEVPSGLTGVYGDELSSVSLPDYFSWTTDGSTILTNAGSSSSFAAKFSPPYYTNSVSGIQIPVLVSKRTVTLDWLEKTKTYDGKNAGVYAIAGNIVEGDTCIVGLTGANEVNAGTYTATASSLSNSNYALPVENTVTYTIAPAPVFFDVSGTTAYYDGQPHTATVTQAATDAVQMAAGDYSVSYRDSEGNSSSSVSEVGTYDIIAAVSNSNFSCAETNLGTFTVEELSDMYSAPENFSSDTWYHTDLIFTAGSGYAISLNSATGYGDSITVSEESSASGTTIPFYVTDTTEGTVYERYITYKLDKTVPTITAVTGNPTAWQNTDATLTVDASDALSGIAAYSFDGGATWQTENSFTYSENTTITADQIQVKDLAGNVASFAEEIVISKIDKTLPNVASHCELSISTVADNTYSINLTASNITSFEGRTFTLTYDAEVLEITDLCAFTYEKETTTGEIAGTGITITGFTPGTITFAVDKTIASGKIWSGTLNIFTFKALKTESSVIEVNS